MYQCILRTGYTFYTMCQTGLFGLASVNKAESSKPVCRVHFYHGRVVLLVSSFRWLVWFLRRVVLLGGLVCLLLVFEARFQVPSVRFMCPLFDVSSGYIGGGCAFSCIMCAVFFFIFASFSLSRSLPSLACCCVVRCHRSLRAISRSHAQVAP